MAYTEAQKLHERGVIEHSLFGKTHIPFIRTDTNAMRKTVNRRMEGTLKRRDGCTAKLSRDVVLCACAVSGWAANFPLTS